VREGLQRKIAEQLALGFFPHFSNITPRRRSFRHTTRQGLFAVSISNTKTKVSGIAIGLVTSSAAPVWEIFRTVQMMAVPPKDINPAFKM
jgi:hypothetical protein